MASRCASTSSMPQSAIPLLGKRTSAATPSRSGSRSRACGSPAPLSGCSPNPITSSVARTDSYSRGGSCSHSVLGSMTCESTEISGGRAAAAARSSSFRSSMPSERTSICPSGCIVCMRRSLREILAGCEDRFDVLVLRGVTRQRPAVDADAVVVPPHIAARFVPDAEKDEIFVPGALEPVVRTFGNEHALGAVEMERSLALEHQEQMVFFGVGVQGVLSALRVDFDIRPERLGHGEQIHRPPLRKERDLQAELRCLGRLHSLHDEHTFPKRISRFVSPPHAKAYAPKYISLAGNVRGMFLYLAAASITG